MKKFWNWMKNEDTGATELYFEGPISAETWLGDEITPGLFKSELEQHPGDFTVWICSPGGDVFAASQIYTMLRNHKGKITVKIDALAASAASVVAMSGDETFISPTGMLMVHDPACFASGNKADMEKAIKILEEVKESIINAYEQKCHLSRSKIAKMMSEETWLNAKKGVTAWLCGRHSVCKGKRCRRLNRKRKRKNLQKRNPLKKHPMRKMMTRMTPIKKKSRRRTW